MSDGDRLERLDVVAALLGYDRPLSDAEQAGIRSATDQERALAEGMGGGPEPLAGPDAVPPDGSRRALGREKRACAFAELYRTFALPGLDAAAREMAGPLLGTLEPASGS